MGREPRLDPDNNVRPEGPQIMKGETKQESLTNKLLNNMELAALKGMAIYWREVAERDKQIGWLHIWNGELDQVIQLLGAEKILRLIAEYVEGRS